MGLFRLPALRPGVHVAVRHLVSPLIAIVILPAGWGCATTTARARGHASGAAGILAGIVELAAGSPVTEPLPLGAPPGLSRGAGDRTNDQACCYQQDYQGIARDLTFGAAPTDPL